MPATKDLTHAFWRRFIVLRFTRQFKEGDKDRDPNIAERIIKDEREKIVPWLIEGAARVLAQSGYTIPPSSRSELDKWKHGADSVAQFIAERLVKANFSRPEAGSDWMTATQLYNHYRIWVESVGIRTPLAMNKFCERLVMLNHARQETKTGSYYQLRARTAKDADDAQLALVQN
jgi:phage/plasmid-associated DNA primase